jgi:peptidoglycan/xylan/chitin deacetylase (PgdA/CDA1 family)
MARTFKRVPRALRLLVRACCAASLSFACSGAPSTPSTGLPTSQAGTASGGGATGGSANAASGGGGMPGGAGSAASVAGGGAAGAGAAGAATAGTSAGGGVPVMFEGGAVAAVSLTYDDGLDPHLAIVQPALEAAGFRGTFYLSNFEGVDHDWALPSVKVPLAPLKPRHLAWMAAGMKGHELADHTVNHPCNAASKAPGFHLTDYDLSRMGTELDESIARLARLGVTQPISFAYPCASDKAGLGMPPTQDYSPLVAARFFAARVSDSGIADPATVDLLHVPQLDTGGKTGDELKKMVDDAIAAKGWLVLLFHGVGTEATCSGSLNYAPDTCMINYLTTSTEAHAALVQYLVDKKAQVWTAPFKQVATQIQTARK